MDWVEIFRVSERFDASSPTLSQNVSVRFACARHSVYIEF
jgi:hypothetical protein